jgi:hypothetical protein
MSNLIKARKGGISHAVMLVLAVIATVLILTVINGVANIIAHPNDALEGFQCRASIIAASRSEELFQGLTKLSKNCPVIEKEIPLKEVYSDLPDVNEVKKVNAMNADEFRKVVMRDFAQLVARAWWMTAEGERSEYFLKKVDQFFSRENKCLVLYAVKTNPPRQYANSFMRITQEDLQNSLIYYNKSGIFEKVFEDDMSIHNYITFSGKGGVLFLDEPIGLDTIYGIAVGFATSDGLTTFAKKLFGKNADTVDPQSSFILIAPYSKIADLCDVER